MLDLGYDVTADPYATGAGAGGAGANKRASVDGNGKVKKRDGKEKKDKKEKKEKKEKKSKKHDMQQ